jgi:two-component system, NarL family, response regulator DevR
MEGVGMDNGTKVIRVFIVDDHEIVRRGLVELFEAETDIEIVGEAGTVADALIRIPLAGVDVAILDYRLPDGDGIEVCRSLNDSPGGPRCLILTSFSDDEALAAAVIAGAAGYLIKEIRGSDLVASVRKVADGQSLLDPTTTAQVLERLRSGPVQDTRLASLTPQERHVLDLVAEGMTNRQIGAELFLAEKTVKNYVSNVLAKLGLNRRTEAAVFAIRAEPRPNPIRPI